MNIGFDAKRAYHNQTGLGHYSRTLIQSLATHYSEHSYYLFNPKQSGLFRFQDDQNIHEINPSGFLNQSFPSLWRSNWVKNDLRRLKIDLYHGLSHEIPLNIHKTGIKSVVTIHDLIHERYPEQYAWADRKIYTKKFRYACEHADRVIAISEQTKQDIMHWYQIPETKIDVCYQSCNPQFAIRKTPGELEQIRLYYQLPETFFLYVGSIIERKNLLSVCKALQLLNQDVVIPLIVIGKGGAYKKQVQSFIHDQGLATQIRFLSDEATASSIGFQTAADFPAIYQLANAMIYPSIFEGFGIPVLEALWSRIPVITSNVSCLPEAGGPGAFYVNPSHPEEMKQQMLQILQNPNLVEQQVETGWRYAQNFHTETTASRIMQVYRGLVS
jgi:glycosyltransferase involved in cell wall biosynthesis